MNRTYSELITIEDFDNRLDYLTLNNLEVGQVVYTTMDQIILQEFYNSQPWRSIRQRIIIRDNGNDLGHADHPINGTIFVHHINEVTVDMIKRGDPKLLDPDNLISSSDHTHKVIHIKQVRQKKYIERSSDEIPWQ